MQVAGRGLRGSRSVEWREGGRGRGVEAMDEGGAAGLRRSR